MVTYTISAADAADTVLLKVIVIMFFTALALAYMAGRKEKREEEKDAKTQSNKVDEQRKGYITELKEIIKMIVDFFNEFPFL